MRLIKRYENRKLYDAQAKRYITLDGIAELIRQGQDVQVIDHTSAEDLTAFTLTQVICDQEKRQAGFMPRSLLADLIQARRDQLLDVQHNLFSHILHKSAPSEELIESVLQTHNIPSREDIDKILAQLDTLSEQLDGLAT